MGLCSVTAQFNLYVATVKEVWRRLSTPRVSLKNAFATEVIQGVDLAAFWPDCSTATWSSHWEDEYTEFTGLCSFEKWTP